MPSIVLLITTAAGVLTLLGGVDREGWFADLDRPGWVPGRSGLGALTLLRLVSVGIAGWWIVDERGWGLVAGLWAVQLVMSTGTPWLLFRGRRLSATFTWICLDWVALGLATAAAWVFVPLAGWALLSQLAVVTWLGAGAFIVWQLDAPSSH